MSGTSETCSETSTYQVLRLLRILTDRGTEYCGARERHEYQLYLAIEDIDHTRTRVKRPQSNGICERFHKTIKHEFYAIAFRKKLYTSLEELQTDLDAWLHYFTPSTYTQGATVTARRPWRRSRTPSRSPRTRS